MTILNEIIEYKKTLLERKYYDKKLEILQDNGNVKRRKLIDSLNYNRKAHLYLNYRNVILFNKLKIIKNMVLMLFQY